VEKGAIGLGALLKFFDHIDPNQRMNPNKLLP
jgi:FAD/FMN-containing dehydrogenase